MLAKTLIYRLVCSKQLPTILKNLRYNVRSEIATFIQPLRCLSSVKESTKQTEEVQTIRSPDSVLHPDLMSSQKPLVERKEQFSRAVDEFKRREKYSKGHVEFIKAAMTRMEELDLQKDIEVYNRIISIFPEGRFVPKRMLDAIWPRSIPQLELSLEILTKMEENGIRPNQETYNLLNLIFGKMSLPVQKCIRIAYLFDKYEFADPYKYYYGDLPTDPVKLSTFILHRITAGKGQVTVHKVGACCQTLLCCLVTTGTAY